MIELKAKKKGKDDLYVATEDIFEYVLEKIENNIDIFKDKFPYFTREGVWETRKSTSDDLWTLGFWPGMLWLAYIETKNKRHEELAYEWMRLIEHMRNKEDHDLGFIFYPSFVKGYELTGDTHLRNVALTAADSLLSLYNPKSNFIQTRPEERGIAAIDTMMNLFLLWWAYEETKDKGYYDAAFSHSVATMKNMIREDGSTVHVVKFDSMTGEIMRKFTLQGYSDTSCWSRGQAWAIYGFTVAYEKTKCNDFLITAKRAANYFLSHLPEDYVPYWDFNEPDIPNTVKDSSGAAIACSALLDLARLVKDKTVAMRYKKTASKILESLTRNYLTKDKNEPGILIHGCLDKPMGLGIELYYIWRLLLYGGIN